MNASSSACVMQADHLKRPLVSVIVTNYNYARFIETCLKSLVQQTYSEFECVVVDDRSTDGSIAIIERLIDSQLGRRFRLIRHHDNLGQMAAFQSGLAQTSGSFVVFVDADDVLFPHFLEAHVSAHLNGLHTAALTNSDQFQIGASGEILSGTFMGIQKDRGDPKGINRTQWQWSLGDGQPPSLEQPVGQLAYYEPWQVSTNLGWMWSTTTAAMFRRDVVDMIMTPACRTLRICSDTYLFHFAHALGGTLIIPLVCGCYRRHGANGFSRNPILDGATSPGDMREYPGPQMKSLCFRHLIANFERFYAVFGGIRMAWLLNHFGSSVDFIKLTSSRETFPRALFACVDREARPEKVFCQVPKPFAAKKFAKRSALWLYLKMLRGALRVRHVAKARLGPPTPAAEPAPETIALPSPEPPPFSVAVQQLIADPDAASAAALQPRLNAAVLETQARLLSRRNGDRLKAYLEESDTFCMMPWVHMHTWPDGRVMTCCLGNPDRPLGHVDNGLKGTWNSDEFKTLRVKLLNGEAAPEHCQRCYGFDQAGHASLRKTANRKFGKHLPEVLAHTAADGTFEPFKLRYLDFRYSNLCNLKCRSCCHDLSSNWYDDSVALYGDKGLPMVIKPRNQGYLKEVLEVLPFVESVYFAGGEPLIQEEHYFILKKLKELGRTDVDLTYATNFTTLTNQKWNVLEYWDGFKSVDLMASLDDSWGRGELLRHGQRWQEIIANRKMLMAAKPNVGSFTFQVCTTVSAMNMWHLVDFHKEWIEQGLVDPDSVLLNLLTTPDYYSAQILPPDEKQRVMDHWHQFMARHLSSHPAQCKKYEAVLTFMNQEDGSHHLPAFVEWMTKLDARRSERFVDVFPEWRPLFERYAA